MIKKIFVGLVVIVLLVVAAFFYLNNRNRTLSPAGSAELNNGGFKVSVTYSRPSVRGRMIFGEKEEGALLPNGYYWRLGANEPTQVSVNQDFKVDGKEIKAGTYTLYAYPWNNEIELRVNSEQKVWGTMQPNESNDVATFIIRLNYHNSATEQFTIVLEETRKGVNVVFLWGSYRWEFPIEKV